MKIKLIKLADIEISGSTQQREKIDLNAVDDYAEAMKCGAKFPPVTLFFDGAQHWLADGFHRYHAYKLAEIIEISADVHEGTNRDARLFSAGANGAHGLRPTNADKRKSVLVLLEDKEWAKWSDASIARHCKVTHPFVGKLRKEILIQPVTVTGDKEKRVLTVNTLSPEAAPGADVENSTQQPPSPAQPEPLNPEDDYSKLDAANDKISDLQDMLAVRGAPDEEREITEKLVSGMREQIKTLTATLEAVTISRDTLLRTNAQLMNQVARQRKDIDKLRRMGAAA